VRERLPWLLIGLFFVLICWRIVDVQLLPDPRVVAQAGQQYWAQVAISTGRGAIEDRNGFPLALSSPSISLFIDPLYWNPSRAKELSPLCARRNKGDLKAIWRALPVARPQIGARKGR